MAKKTMTVYDIARAMRCTLPALAAQYRVNLDQLRADLADAESSGKKVRGYSASDLRAIIDTIAARLAECDAAIVGGAV